MTGTGNVVKQSILGLLSLVLVSAYPAAVLAIETANGDSPPATGPDGTDTTTYSYNETTGMWENDRYIWDPVKRLTYPKNNPGYSYNPSTGAWDTPDWAYDTVSGTYQPNTTLDSEQLAHDSGAPDAPSTSSETAQSPPQSTVAIAEPSTGFSGFYNASISNNLYLDSKSGDASVSGNTYAGSATSGGSTAISTVLNLLQSSASVGDLNKVATFTTNIDGSVFGDLYIDPNIIGAPQTGNSPGGSLSVNSSAENTIANSIAIEAGSGNATVSGNTLAGNATTGSANAVLNLINLINSSIASGQSFLGLLNINGNLNGDILLPQGSLSSLLATNDSSGMGPGTIAVDNSGANSISNGVVVTASSGDAAVTSNTSGGDAKSGNATTNLTIFNLTGHQIVASNSLVVFVNVLGQWIGAILDAPASSTAAILGGGVTEHNEASDSTDISSTNNNSINNSASIVSHSGDALVHNNTTAGSATSGDATASANIMNISNSNLSVSGWFGILFINVFGIWSGSFGIDTAAGNPEIPGVSPPPGTYSTTNNGPADDETPQVFRFAPNTVSYEHSDQVHLAGLKSLPSQENSTDPLILGVTSSDHRDGPGPAFSPTQRDINMAVSGVILGAILVGIERSLAYRDSRRLRRGGV